METESNSENSAASPLERHLRRVGRYRTGAFLVLAGCIVYAMVPHMNHAAKSAAKVADVVASAAPTRATTPHSLALSAFELGKSVSDYSALQSLDERPGPGHKSGQALAKARAALQARLAALQLGVNPDALEFTWKPGVFDSPAAALIADTLARKFGEPLRTPYVLGAGLMSARWRVARWSDTRDDQDTLLAPLDEMTHTMIGTVDLGEFQPSTAVADLVRSENDESDTLLLHLFSLDLAVETRLGY